MKTCRLRAAMTMAAAIVLASAAPASAHVTTDPDSAPQGAEITLRFRVPNEVTGTNLTRVDIAFPTDHPLLGVLPETVPGWTATATEVKLNPPVQTDDGPVAQAVSQITWSAAGPGGGTPPGQFQEFPVLVQRLPTDTAQVAFKAVQAYGDGSVVRWIDPVAAGQAPPEHPTPILRLTTASASGGATTATTVDLAHLARKSTVSSARTLGGIGIAFGALGLIVALVALRRRES